MRKINTLAELRAEHRRLSERKIWLEAEIKKDFTELRESMEPVNLIKSSAEKVMGGKTGVLATTAASLATILMKTTMKNSGLLSRLIIPIIVKKVTGRMVEKNKGKIMDLFSSVFMKRKTLG
jgi:hypothetical protein